MPRISDPQLTQQWRDRLARFDQSELSVAQFCQREGYSAASFYRWRQKLRADRAHDHRSPFVTVEPPHTTFGAAMADRLPSDTGLLIELPGGAIVRLDHQATDEQRCRLIKNVIDSVGKVVS